MEEPKTSPCRGCGKPIVWGVTEQGSKIPMDPKPPVYFFDATKGLAERVYNAYVSHWATCPEAFKAKGERAWEKTKGEHQ